MKITIITTTAPMKKEKNNKLLKQNTTELPNKLLESAATSNKIL